MEEEDTATGRTLVAVGCIPPVESNTALEGENTAVERIAAAFVRSIGRSGTARRRRQTSESKYLLLL